MNETKLPGRDDTRVFVAYSLTDSVADEVLRRLEARYAVRTSVSIHGPVPRATALREAFAWADLTVGILPPPQDRSRTNVIFELGMAVGGGLPVLLISGSGGIPRDLAELSFVDVDSLSHLDQAIEDVRQRTFHEEYLYQGGVMPRSHESPVRVREAAPPESESRFAGLTEVDLLNYVESRLRDSGARVSRGSASKSSRLVEAPDLVVWDDALLPTFGLPVPFEIIRSTDRFAQLKSRLKKTLDASGARSLIAVAASGKRDRRWSDGKSILLAVTAANFDQAMRMLPVADALGTLLEGAEK